MLGFPNLCDGSHDSNIPPTCQ
jgi:hypothetical protein